MRKLLFTVLMLLPFMSCEKATTEFSNVGFENIIEQNFKTDFQSDIEYIAVNFRTDKGCQYWTARIKTTESYYNTFFKEINLDNWGKRTNIKDKTTGFMIRYTYKSRYMSGINYEIDFFEDNQTIRIYIIDCP